MKAAWFRLVASVTSTVLLCESSLANEVFANLLGSRFFETISKEFSSLFSVNHLLVNKTNLGVKKTSCYKSNIAYFNLDLLNLQKF